MHCCPGCEISYGIAPYSMTFAFDGPLKIPAFWKRKYISTFARISATVTTGKRSVGMLSLSGNTRREPRRSGGRRERADARAYLRHMLVRVIGRADERSGRDVVEPEGVRGLLE